MNTYNIVSSAPPFVKILCINIITDLKGSLEAITVSLDSSLWNLLCFNISTKVSKNI